MNGHRPLPGTETGLQSTGPLAAHRAAGHCVPENPEFRGPHGARYRSRNQLDEWAFNAKHLAQAKHFRRLTHLGKDRLVKFDLVVRNFNHQQAEPNFSQAELVFDVLVERYENFEFLLSQASSLPLETPPQPISTTVLTSCPWNAALTRGLTHSSRRIRIQ